MIAAETLMRHVRELRYLGRISDEQLLCILSAPYVTERDITRLESCVIGLILSQPTPSKPS